MSYIHYSFFDGVLIHNSHPLFIDDVRIVHLVFVYVSSLETNRTNTILLCLLYNLCNLLYLYLYFQVYPKITKVVSSNPTMGTYTRRNIM